MVENLISCLLLLFQSTSPVKTVGDPQLVLTLQAGNFIPRLSKKPEDATKGLLNS